MFRRFIDGLVFGLGFSISYFLLWYLSAEFITPQIEAEEVSTAEQLEQRQPQTGYQRGVGVLLAEFHAMSTDDQIRHASGIAIARFEKNDAGETRAVIREFLKKDPNAEFYYDVGDALRDEGHYRDMEPTADTGLLVFFVGSPATTASSSTFYGDRIYALGDMPLDVLRRKVAEAE